MEKFGFPGIIGCIDGTHVALVRPAEHEEAFLNRKFFHSLNVMVVSIYLLCINYFITLTIGSYKLIKFQY